MQNMTYIFPYLLRVVIDQFLHSIDMIWQSRTSSLRSNMVTFSTTFGRWTIVGFVLYWRASTLVLNEDLGSIHHHFRDQDSIEGWWSGCEHARIIFFPAIRLILRSLASSSSTGPAGPLLIYHAFSSATVLSGVGRLCFLSFFTTVITLAADGGNTSRHLETSASTLLRLNDLPASQTARHMVPAFMIPRSSTQ